MLRMASASHQVHAGTEACGAVWRDLMREAVAYLVVRRQGGAGQAPTWHVFAVDEELARKIQAGDPATPLDVALDLDGLASDSSDAVAASTASLALDRTRGILSPALGARRERGRRRTGPPRGFGPPFPNSSPGGGGFGGGFGGGGGDVAQPPPPSVASPDPPLNPVPGPASDPTRPVVIVDQRGNTLGLAEPSVAGEEGMLYPSLTKEGVQAIAPGEVGVFEISLSLSPPFGVAMGYAFDPSPKGDGDVKISAQVSSTSLRPADDQPWSQSFSISRQSGPSPSRWSFRALAVEDRSVYDLSVAFSQGGRPLGQPMRCRLPRRGNDAVPPGAQTSAVPLRMGAGGQAAADELTMQITSQGRDHHLFTLLRGGDPVDKPELWPMNVDDFFVAFEQARALIDLRNKGSAMFGNLPRSVKAFLSDPLRAEMPLHIVSDAVLMPFELLAGDDGRFLGGARPVSRWIWNTEPIHGPCRVTGVATICPAYLGADALPGAILEGTDLEARFAGERQVPICKIATEDELRELLTHSDIQLVHFAGHSNSDPAGLVLQGNVHVGPEVFARFNPLLKARPVMFLNGCRAGFGHPTTPAMLANMPVALLSAGCRAVVAPLVKVNSDAARSAATTFYDAIAANATVAQAVQRVRLKGEAASSLEAALSYMSYVAYAPPDLALNIQLAPGP